MFLFYRNIYNFSQLTSIMKKKTPLKIALILIILFFFILGIIFFVTILHEYYHVFTMKGATAICLPVGFNLNDELQQGNMIMYTQINTSKYDSLYEYEQIREVSEKSIGIIQWIIFLTLLLFIGILIGKVI
jgi:hypothetical protein